MKLTLLPLSEDGLVRVQAEGALTLRYMPVGIDPLQQLLGPYFCTHRLLLDLSEATGVDTSGLSWLLQSTSAFEKAHGKLVLVAVPYSVGAFFDLLQVGSFLTIAARDAEARELALGLHQPGDDVAEPSLRALGMKRPPRAV